MSSEFEKQLKTMNDELDTLELKIFKLEFELKYNKMVVKKLEIKKRKLLSTYKY
mgnify:CR=1 FL=1